MEDAGGGEHDRTDGVGEPWRTGVLDRTFPDPGLDPFEVGDARQAVAATEEEPDYKLRGEDRQQRPPVEEKCDERKRADHGLVEAGSPRVDYFCVSVGIGCPQTSAVRAVMVEPDGGDATGSSGRSSGIRGGLRRGANRASGWCVSGAPATEPGVRVDHPEVGTPPLRSHRGDVSQSGGGCLALAPVQTTIQPRSRSRIEASRSTSAPKARRGTLPVSLNQEILTLVTVQFPGAADHTLSIRRPERSSRSACSRRVGVPVGIT